MLQFFFHISLAQDSSSDSSVPTTTSSVSLTPQMSASAVSSLYSVLATSSPQQPGTGKSIYLENYTTTRTDKSIGPQPGDAGSSGGSSSVDSEAGASGSDNSSINISHGAVIAIIVVAVFVCVFGSKSQPDKNS